MQTRQTGFTLIEITIVLVIIGLLLGGVIKGQELINNAKVKNLAADFKNTLLLIHAYQDKFQALPGDDIAATVNVSASASNGNGNGNIDGNWNDIVPASGAIESVSFWQSVRLANLATGSTKTSDANFLPKNSLGGRLGVQSNSETNSPIKNGTETIRGTYVICSAGISGQLAKQLDRVLDDGDTASGSVLVGLATTVGTSMTALTSLSDNQTYTVCMGV